MYFKTGYIPSRADLHKQLETYQKNVHLFLIWEHHLLLMDFI
ncbi:hypothetical protein [Cylindrospermopsis curvispora]|nr:hypothetical protein [Cylindrospermopsis curvispora]